MNSINNVYQYNSKKISITVINTANSSGREISRPILISDRYFYALLINIIRECLWYSTDNI